MNWNAIGAIAELLGALAVLVTLAYLTMQIRQNRKLLEQNGQLLASALADSRRDAVNDLNRLLAAEPEATRVYWGGLKDRDALQENEQHQFDAMISLVFNYMQQTFDQGNTDSPGLLWVLGWPGIRSWWKLFSGVYTPEFRQFVDSRITETTVDEQGAPETSGPTAVQQAVAADSA